MGKTKINLIFALILVVTIIYFVNGATYYNECPKGYEFNPEGVISWRTDSSGDTYISRECVPIVEEILSSIKIEGTSKQIKSQAEIDCGKLGFCWYQSKCYGIGNRMIVEPEYRGKHSWVNNSYLYCGISKKFISQRLTGEFCENDFECKSNQCLDNKCIQEQGIQIKEELDNDGVIKRNLLFREKHLFYFSGLNNNYSIGFDKNESDFIFLINNETYILENKTFNLDNYSQIIIESISFNDGLSSANITFIEGNNLLNDSSNSKEVSENEGLNQITGNIIQEPPKETEEKLALFEKITNFLKNLFS